MSNDEYNALERNISQLNGRINSMEGEIAAGLENVRRAIQAGTQETVRQLQTSIEVNTRTEIAKEIAILNAIGPIIQVQVDNLGKEEKRASKNAERVELKYDEIEKELNDSYLRDIRHLGAHIYDILENDYEKGVRKRYSRSGYGLLSQAISDTENERREGISRRLAWAKQEVQKFAGKRRQFRQNITSKLVDGLKHLQGQDIAISFWVVTVRDEAGIAREVAIGPSRVKVADTGECRIEFEEDERFARVKARLLTDWERITKEYPVKNMTQEESSSLTNALTDLTNKNRQAITTSMKDLIIGMIRKKPMRVSL